MTIVIDPEFRGWMPKLTDDEYSMLEENIIKDGCRDPLVLWGDVLVDGHNRYQICCDHDKDFNTVQIEFSDREDVLDWIDKTQAGRRNLPPDQMSLIRGRRYNRLKRQGARTDLTLGQNVQKSTAEKLAEEHGVNEKTIRFFNLGEEVVALCDIDQGRLDGAYNQVKGRCAGAEKYRDFREMLAKERDLDAVVVSTPDHMHATAAIAAMKCGYHVYVEKPLVRTVWEVRQFKRIAEECGVISQMGNNGNGSSAQRRRIEIYRSGILGRIKEVHVTTNRPIWPQGLNRPEGSDPIPGSLSWDLWLGVAPERPFKKGVYHHFKWRGWYDFGTGALGDIACHSMSDFFRGFKLREVLSVECVKSTPRFKETYPLATTVKTVYRSDMQAEPITVYWYDGDTRPDHSVCPKAAEIFGNLRGDTIITDRAVLRGDSISWNEDENFRGFAKDERCREVKQSIPRVKGHHWEFAEAIRGGDKPLSHHEYSVPLTEGVLLGCIAQRVPGELKWNAAEMKFDNSLEADKLLRPYVREGWNIV